MDAVPVTPGETVNLIRQEMTLELVKVMVDGVGAKEAKDLRERFKVVFEDEKFSLNPPALDEWMARRVKSLANHKTIELQEKILVSTQFKVMDVASPLLDLLCQLRSRSDDPNMAPMISSAKAALLQWARAFNHLTKKRRHNMLMSTVPKSEYLLDSDTAFKPEETIKFLFGPNFLNAMADQAKLDQVFNQIGGTKAIPSTSGVQTRQQTKSAAASSNRGKNRGGSNTHGFGGGNQRYKPLFNFTSIETLNDIPVGGRLKFFAHNWPLLTNDP